MLITTRTQNISPIISSRSARKRGLQSALRVQAAPANFPRDALSYSRIEECTPTIDHLLVIPPVAVHGLSAEDRETARLFAFCSQNDALQVLAKLRPTHLFPEAQIHDRSACDALTRKQIARDFAEYPNNSVRPEQMQHLMMRTVADIYAAMSAVRIKSSIGEERARQCAAFVTRHLEQLNRSPDGHGSGETVALDMLYDLPAEDMARRIEHFVGGEDFAGSRVAVISQYPFALGAHLNPHIRVRTHDCTAEFVPHSHTRYLQSTRRRMIVAAIERKFAQLPPL